MFRTSTSSGAATNTHPLRHSLNSFSNQLHSSGSFLSRALTQKASNSALHTFTVTNSNDRGTGSLRQAILNANSDSKQNPQAKDVINFSKGVHTVQLTSATLDITARNLTINGTGMNTLTINGNNRVKNFTIENNANVTISGVTITQGKTQQDGGGILNRGSLILNNSSLTTNNAAGSGGAIFSSGSLTLNNDTFSNNIAQFNGGAVTQLTAPITVSGSVFIGNQAGLDGGGLWNTGILTLSASTFSNNTAVGNGGGLWTGGNTTIANSIFTSNKASSGGGIFQTNLNGGNTSINGCTFNQNIAPLSQNGVLIQEGFLAFTSTLPTTTAIDNCTFIGNTFGFQSGQASASLVSDMNNVFQ